MASKSITKANSAFPSISRIFLRFSKSAYRTLTELGSEGFMNAQGSNFKTYIPHVEDVIWHEFLRPLLRPKRPADAACR
jgi:hypothetical protein